MPRKTLELTRGQANHRAPVDERQAELPAYFVQLRSRTSTTRLEGFVDASLPDAPQPRVPRPGGRAPPGLRPAGHPGPRHQRRHPGAPAVRRPVARTDPVAGLRHAAGDAGVGHDLRALACRCPPPGCGCGTACCPRPSATDHQRPRGARTELRARGGRFEVRVLPPAQTGLPEAQLPESAGVIIPEGALEVPLDFQYAALPASRLELTVNTPGGQPGQQAGRGAAAEPGGRARQRGQLRLRRQHGAGQRHRAPASRQHRRHGRVRARAPRPLPGDGRPARRSARRSGHHQRGDRSARRRRHRCPRHRPEGAHAGAGAPDRHGAHRRPEGPGQRRRRGRLPPDHHRERRQRRPVHHLRGHRSPVPGVAGADGGSLGAPHPADPVPRAARCRRPTLRRCRAS